MPKHHQDLDLFLDSREDKFDNSVKTLGTRHRDQVDGSQWFQKKEQPEEPFKVFFPRQPALGGSLSDFNGLAFESFFFTTS